MSVDLVVNRENSGEEAGGILEVGAEVMTAGRALCCVTFACQHTAGKAAG